MLTKTSIVTTLVLYNLVFFTFSDPYKGTSASGDPFWYKKLLENEQTELNQLVEGNREACQRFLEYDEGSSLTRYKDPGDRYNVVDNIFANLYTLEQFKALPKEEKENMELLELYNSKMRREVYEKLNDVCQRFFDYAEMATLKKFTSLGSNDDARLDFAKQHLMQFSESGPRFHKRAYYVQDKNYQEEIPKRKLKQEAVGDLVVKLGGCHGMLVNYDSQTHRLNTIQQGTMLTHMMTAAHCVADYLIITVTGRQVFEDKKLEERCNSIETLKKQKIQVGDCFGQRIPIGPMNRVASDDFFLTRLQDPLPYNGKHTFDFSYMNTRDDLTLDNIQNISVHAFSPMTGSYYPIQGEIVNEFRGKKINEIMPWVDPKDEGSSNLVIKAETIRGYSGAPCIAEAKGTQDSDPSKTFYVLGVVHSSFFGDTILTQMPELTKEQNAARTAGQSLGKQNLI